MMTQGLRRCCPGFELPVRPSFKRPRLIPPLLLVAVLLAAAGQVVLAAERPNIVFLLADDLGYADCGFNGGTDIDTPNLDRLAEAGTILESFYAQPLCSPTRASLMTGRYPMRQGLQVDVIWPHAKFGMPLEERTLPQALREEGYATAICGKWHLGSFNKAYWPGSRGFDQAYGNLFGSLDYLTHRRDNTVDWYRNGERIEGEGYTTHLIAREAVRFIRQQDVARPFFLYVPFNAVHTPLQVPDEYAMPYAHMDEEHRTIAGMLAAMDEAVGQIVSAVEDKGLRDRTLFVFSSDNGGFIPGRLSDNGPLRAGKGTVYEGGVRVCAFATWDRHIPAGVRLNEPLHIVDWYPTLLNLAGVSLDQSRPIDGKDIWPTLTQGKASPHEEILLNSAPSGGAIRMGDWKLVVRPADISKWRNPGAGPAGNAALEPGNTDAFTLELYNLANDLGENNDIASGHPDKVRELRARYQTLASQAVPPKNAVPRFNPWSQNPLGPDK